MKSKIVQSIFVVVLVLLSINVEANDLSIHFLDVGQADSIFLKLPDGLTILIDGGNNDDGDDVVNYLQKQGVSRIDYLIGTHPHEDHIGGLDDVILSLEIGQIYMPQVTHTTKTFEDLLLAIKEKGKRITAAKRGVTIIDQPELKAYFLSPARNDYEELNHWSAVLKLEYGYTSFLFMGDAEEYNEFEILTMSSVRPYADLLKVGHHGSDSSTSVAFLEAVMPRYAVISVGKDNDYGHPSPVVLNRLNEHGVEVYRTDEPGTIICHSDGKIIWFDKPAYQPVPVEIDDNSKIQIMKVNLQGEIVLIKNNGNHPVDLSGWKLLSVKGSQDFFFPAGTILQAGKEMTIASGRNAENVPGAIIWSKSYIWNNEGDPAELYDNKGRLVSRF